MDFGTGVFELIQKGGFFVYPIILCSIVGLAIFLQKMWVLRSKNIIPEVFLEQLYHFLSQGKLGEAEVYSRANNSSISRVALAALENSDKPKEELREEIEEAGRKETLELMRYAEGLGTISNVSTLLGLLGTISGMIKIFRVIADKPIVNPPELAGGISEALYTTAFGLLVAIPAFIAYKYVVGRADELISLMEEEGRKIMEYVIVAKENETTNPTDPRDILG
ncbi:MAG: MotA/TolQ/ExbB proton channel family protein [Thermodesulfobacteriales bacterium]